MPKLKSIVPLTPAEAEAKNVITKRELQALVTVAKCHLHDIGEDEEWVYIGQQRAKLATSAVRKIECTIAEMGQ